MTTTASKSALFNKVAQYLETLGYYCSEDSVYCLDFWYSVGIELSQDVFGDGFVCIQLRDEDGCESKTGALRVSDFDSAKAIVDKLHFINNLLHNHACPHCGYSAKDSA